MDAVKVRLNYYRKVKPSLPGWPIGGQPMHVGMHCRGTHDLRFIEDSHAPVSIVEIKPDKFVGKDKLFYSRRGEFHRHRKNQKKLFRELKGMDLAAQTHFPIKVLEEQSLNPGITEDHPAIISLFKALVRTIQEYDMLHNVTFHPPTLMWGGRWYIHENDAGRALDNTKRLLGKLGDISQKQSWPIRLGIENQADPTPNSFGLGYLPTHIRALLTGSPNWVNVTIDSGHRNLCQRLSVSEILYILADLNRELINLHFHENQGIQAGDEHRLPLGAHIHGYINYLNRAVQERVPIIIEVNTRVHNPIEFALIVGGIRYYMEKIEEERRALYE
ncbi:MAG: hypothetical protein HQ564_08085 [Candidatus Saganbacteria bacterium]|nr:hypothetical protein [Candidatus Saganbacteria bacterium]